MDTKLLFIVGRALGGSIAGAKKGSPGGGGGRAHARMSACFFDALARDQKHDSMATSWRLASSRSRARLEGVSYLALSPRSSSVKFDQRGILLSLSPIPLSQLVFLLRTVPACSSRTSSSSRAKTYYGRCQRAGIRESESAAENEKSLTMSYACSGGLSSSYSSCSSFSFFARRPLPHVRGVK